MRVEELDYDLPSELIAQAPAERRDGSRLLVARGHGEPLLEHRAFHELPDLLHPGDLLVLNDVRVLPARVMARRESGGQVEILLLRPVDDAGRRWRALARPARRVQSGSRLALESAGGHEASSEKLGVEVVETLERGERVLQFPAGVSVTDWLERHGAMPLPPYVHAEAEAARRQLDRERYQTVYAASPGAVAAPTAGLHFTDDLLARLRQRGVETAFLTLHVGPGTFRPVTSERVEEHVMDSEAYVIPEDTAEAVGRARTEHRRVVCVGTTAVRTLEHSASLYGRVVPGAGVADLFVTPGYRFAVVDAMITNFHLPRSTPILLVAALLGKERLMAAYQDAVARGYRFYSYGDAMLVLP